MLDFENRRAAAHDRAVLFIILFMIMATTLVSGVRILADTRKSDLERRREAHAQLARGEPWDEVELLHDQADRYSATNVVAAPAFHSSKNSAMEHFRERAFAGEGLHLRDLPDDQSHYSGRRLNDDSLYQPLRIHWDTSNLDALSSSDPSYDTVIAEIKDTVLPAVNVTWASALSILPARTGLYFLDGICGPDISIPRSYDIDGVGDTDLVVFVSGFRLGNSGCTASTLVFSSPCLLLARTDRPVVGTMWMCLDNLKYERERKGTELEVVSEVASHEFGHLLGMSSVLYPFYRDRSTPNLDPRTPERKSDRVQCWDGQYRNIIAAGNTTVRSGTKNGARYFEIVTPTVRQVVRNHFSCQALEGARLENQNPVAEEDCYGDHWNERLFHTELMGATRELRNILSPLTLALMDDTGWYKANYSVSEISPFGHDAGCSFVEEDCIDNGTVPLYSKGYFCNRQRFVKNNELKGFYECDPSHTHAAQCDLVNHGVFAEGYRTPPPANYQYFENKMIGPIDFIAADYCPVVHENAIDCRDSSGIATVEGESFDSTSRCYNAQFPALFSGSTAPFAVCLHSVCNEEDGVVEIHVKGETIVCLEDFERHRYPGLDPRNTIECPRLAAVCPHLLCPKNCNGKGICNATRCKCFDISDTSPDCSSTAYEAYMNPFAPKTQTSGSTANAEYFIIVQATVILAAALGFWRDD